MAVKTTLTLDNKADYDLLVQTLEERADAIRLHLDLDLSKPNGERMPRSQSQPLQERRFALENLIKQVS